MSRIHTIASGSTGNCTYIGNGKSGILVDVGISAKAVTDALTDAAVDPSYLMGIFVTHEHIDHIRGLKAFAKKYGVPVFASFKTAKTLISDGILTDDILHPFDGDIDFDDLKVRRFATSHDCEGSSGYTVFLKDGQKCSVCTDLGFVSEEVRAAITGSTAIVLESNHDVNMLYRGSYPEYLKKRILSDKGHLSNNACAKELPALVKSGATRIILGHLSRENNTPEIARSASAAALMDCGIKENEDYLLYVAPPKNGRAVLF